ncbi:hypothetical protein ACFZDP_08490 [Streptomyces mirabilis]|uniref:hypothetical protein n=1 Tax=Streptomyces mirabilis TaxID=68239 RepID=UPI0006BAB77E|nr:hypothetical protein OK006_3665 [Actinobacteria bacterium OK006]
MTKARARTSVGCLFGGRRPSLPDGGVEARGDLFLSLVVGVLIDQRRLLGRLPVHPLGFGETNADAEGVEVDV